MNIEKDQNDLKSLYEAVSKYSIEINDYILATRTCRKSSEKIR